MAQIYLPWCTPHDVFRRHSLFSDRFHRSESQSLSSRLWNQHHFHVHRWGNPFPLKAVCSCRGVRHCIRGILDEFAKSITLKAHCDLYTVLLDGALWTKDVVLAQREMKDDLPPQCELTLELDIPQPNKLDDRLQAFYCTLYTGYI